MPAGNPMAYSAYRKAKGGKDMSYEDYMKFAAKSGLSYLGKADFEAAEQEEDEADQEGEQEEEEGDLDKSSNSTIGAEALIKAISDYETISEAMVASGTSRESYLKERLDTGMISKAEQAELGRLWAGGGLDTTETLQKSLGDRMVDENPDAAGLVDASDFLKSLVDTTSDALNDLSGQVEREGMVTRNLLGAQGTLLKSTAVVLAQQSSLIKSQQAVISEMGRRLGVLESEPVVRKSHGAPDPRDVSHRDATQAGSAGRGRSTADALTKSQVTQGFRGLLAKADAANDAAAIDKLTHATALFESTGRLNPNIAGAIRMELGL